MRVSRSSSCAQRLANKPTCEPLALSRLVIIGQFELFFLLESFSFGEWLEEEEEPAGRMDDWRPVRVDEKAAKSPDHTCWPALSRLSIYQLLPMESCMEPFTVHEQCSIEMVLMRMA